MEIFRSKNDCYKTISRGLASSEDLLDVGPESQCVFSAGKPKVLKVNTGVVVLVVSSGGGEASSYLNWG